MLRSQGRRKCNKSNGQSKNDKNSQIASKRKDTARWIKTRHWRAGSICLKSGLDGGRQQEHGTANDHQVDSPEVRRVSDESKKVTNRRMQHSSTNFIHQRRCTVAGIEGGGGCKHRVAVRLLGATMRGRKILIKTE
ncbi:conserved hypothetical protein [Aspergillus udagawae]|uniref:Uncharacterized protein n=1 Tax=Aspergillus udagawae TaxID=91492 RepID=A0A8H3P4T8_9EURO|nr:conserved hypothetical protein [Aspergillus udagawae]